MHYIPPTQLYRSLYERLITLWPNEVDRFLTTSFFFQIKCRVASLRFSYGAIKRLGSANPNLVTDLIYFLATSARGVPTFSIPPVLVCTSTPISITSTSASNTRYVGAQMGNSAGNVTLVYTARDGEHDACFKTYPTIPVLPDKPASQCSSFAPATRVPMPSITPTFAP